MSNFIKIILIIFLSFLGMLKGIAQDLNFRGVSPSVSITDALKNNFDINFLTTSKIRLGNYIIKETGYSTQVQEIYSQLLSSYKINKHWQTGIGYGFQRNNPFDKNYRNEHRLVQQVLYNTAGKKLSFYNRFRFEERWFSYPTASNQFATRARYQAGLLKKIKGNDFYWQINDEIYCVPSRSRNTFISENWIYGGIGFPVMPFGHLETGIGYNTVVRNSNKDLQNLLLLQVSWSYIFPAIKMKTMNAAMHSRNF